MSNADECLALMRRLLKRKERGTESEGEPILLEKNHLNSFLFSTEARSKTENPVKREEATPK